LALVRLWWGLLLRVLTFGLTLILLLRWLLVVLLLFPLSELLQEYLVSRIGRLDNAQK
jgi:hypothetical protein